MRRIALAALGVVTLAGCGEQASPRVAATEVAAPRTGISIVTPENGAVLPVPRDGAPVVVLVSGRSSPGTPVIVTGTCGDTTCRQGTTAGAGGTYVVRLRLRVAGDQQSVNVGAFADDGSRAASVVVARLEREGAADSSGGGADRPRRSRAGGSSSSGGPGSAQEGPPTSAPSPASPSPAPAPAPPPPAAPPAAAPARPATGSVVMVGDSLAEGTEPHLAGVLPGASVRTDARRGRPLAEGMAAIRALPSRPRVLMVSLFTNDGPSATDALRTATTEALRRADCVVWATIVRPPVGGRSYAAANRVLREAAARAPGRFVVVPWDTETTAHPEWMARDGVHATPAGYRARASSYAQASARCR